MEANKNINHIKEELEEKRAEILSFLKPAPQGDEDNPDSADLAHHYQQSEQKNSLDSYNQNLLIQIEDALQKIEAGTYGICDQCGKAIAPERLEIMPYAKYCMDCLNRFPSRFIYSSSVYEE